MPPFYIVMTFLCCLHAFIVVVHERTCQIGPGLAKKIYFKNRVIESKGNALAIS